MRRNVLAWLALVSGVALGLGLAPAAVAEAGEHWLGNITVTDGGTASNWTTGPSTAAGVLPVCTDGWFAIPTDPSTTKLSVQCDQDCLVGVDVAGCDAGNCLRLGAGQILPTTATSRTLTGGAYNWDGGAQSAPCAVTKTGGWISVAPWNTDGGGTTCVCHVHSRPGNE